MTDQGERRQTNEVAIARLEVNVEYIKQAVDEIKKQSCQDCVTGVALRAHIEDHKKYATNRSSNIKYLITTMVAVIAILISVFMKGPSATAQTSRYPAPQTSQQTTSP